MARPCLHLRSKEMFYQEAGAPPSEYERAMQALSVAPPAAHACWCFHTQTGRGPDDQPAGEVACSDPGRGCFKGIEHIV